MRSDEQKRINVRWGWLKFMYIYTIIGAGGFGLGIIMIPDTMISILYMIIFATYIVGDLIAIPFPYLFSIEKDSRRNL